MILDTQAYLDTLCTLLEDGHTQVPVSVSGTSMTPFFDPGDTVFLDLPQAAPETGDVVLFTRSSGQYVLHRVVGRFPDGTLELLGDAQLRAEPVPPGQVRAIVTGLRRGHKLYNARSLRWRFFRGPWRHIRRLRTYVNRIRNYIKK